MLAEDMRCPGCGQPKHEAWNPDSAGWYEHREAECQGCAELERAAKKDKEHHPERKRWVQDTRPPDVELMPWTPGQELPTVAGSPRRGAAPAEAGVGDQ